MDSLCLFSGESIQESKGQPGIRCLLREKPILDEVGNCQKRIIADSLDHTFCGVCNAITFRNHGHGVVPLSVFAGPDVLAQFNVILEGLGGVKTTQRYAEHGPSTIFT